MTEFPESAEALEGKIRNVLQMPKRQACTTLKPRVVIHTPQGVDFRSYVMFGDDVEVYAVDENIPKDRVYRMSPNSLASELDEVIGDGPIGHAGDERHKLATLIYGDGTEPPKGN